MRQQYNDSLPIVDDITMHIDTDDTIKYIIEVSEGFNPVGTASVDPDTIFPMAIKHAALLLVGQYYDNRNAVTIGANNSPMALGFEYLLDPYKIQIIL